MVFAVTLYPPSTNTISVAYSTATVAGSAVNNGTYQDFVATNGVLIFPPGITNQSLTVGVRGDSLFELSEIFNLNLLSPTNGSLGRSKAEGRIINDDPMPVVTIQGTSLAEGDSGTNNAIFTVMLSTMSGAPVELAYSTSNGTATAESDYLARTGVVGFAQESPSLSRTITVPILGDIFFESSETFYLVFTGISNALMTITNASCTILNDDNVGPLHHFTWAQIGNQQAGEPFPVTLTAKDISDTTISNFTGTALLSGWAMLQSSNAILGDIATTNAATGNWTLAYGFTPQQDMRVTHFRHYWGNKVSIWANDGVVLAAQNVTSIPGTWVTTPLANPVTLSAGTTYRLGAYTGGGAFYYLTNFPTSFPDGTLGNQYYSSGDNFPQSTDAGIFFVLDLAYTIGTNTPSPVTPIVTGDFEEGIWHGDATVIEGGTGFMLKADDGGQHVGWSNPFVVASENDADLAVTVSVSPSSVPVGSNVVFTAVVTNCGPGIATDVRLLSALPIQFLSASAGEWEWEWTNSGQLVTATLASLPPGSNATFSVTARTALTGQFTNHVSVSANQLDITSTNNSASTYLSVFVDADNDGMDDEWETLYGLNPANPNDAHTDPDQDGMNNIQEFLAGTHPDDAASLMRIEGVETHGPDLYIAFRGVIGKAYNLERTDDLQSPWRSVRTFQATSDTPLTVIDRGAAGFNVLFYRVRVAP